MKVVFDTNVLLDQLAHREPFYSNSKNIFQLVSKKRLAGFVTSNSITDIYYIMRRGISVGETKRKIRRLLKSLTIISVDSNDIHSALNHQVVDVEDALLAVCAEKIKADYIITRDEDFLSQKPPIKVISPNDFMLTYRQNLPPLFQRGGIRGGVKLSQGTD
jgi:predicted nucleic acid-binding protein